jgi:hypothetical protein
VCQKLKYGVFLKLKKTFIRVVASKNKLMKFCPKKKTKKNPFLGK